jgi:hypothetical protein
MQIPTTDVAKAKLLLDQSTFGPWSVSMLKGPFKRKTLRIKTIWATVTVKVNGSCPEILAENLDVIAGVTIRALFTELETHWSFKMERP